MAVPPKTRGHNRRRAKDISPREVAQQAQAGCVRALADGDQLSVQFGNNQPSLEGDTVTLTSAAAEMTLEKRAIWRGQADALALESRYHDAGRHRELAPAGGAARAVFDRLEAVRLEARGCAVYAGVGDNLDAALRNRFSGLIDNPDSEYSPLAEALALHARERLTGRPTPDVADAIVSKYRSWLDQHIDLDYQRLSQCLDNQVAFAKIVSDMIAGLGLGDGEAETSGSQSAEPPDQDANEDGPQNCADEASDDDNGGEADDSEADADADSSDELVDPGDEDTDGEAASSPERAGKLRDPEAYSVYCTEYDEVIAAEKLALGYELDELRAQLDRLVGDQNVAIGRVANRLQRRLLAQQKQAWQVDLEEGELNTARLSRIITRPERPLAFKQAHAVPYRDTVVTLLLDNSGSMRGRPIAMATSCADILARMLERCGVRTEVLGFTTRAWKGGQSRERWQREGSPRNPGRLNDLRHIIYKTADAPWRRSRRNLGLMLQKGLLKENIDGEALAWAHNRLLVRPERRRILMMISDGAPIDDSTLSVNAGKYLDRHLREVIIRIESQSPIELVAIGIGHDVTQYYQRAVTIVNVDELADVMTQELASLFDTTT